jgi:hypothetical protein
MARDVFRRRWFPRARRSIGLSSVSASPALDGVESTAQVGVFSQQIDAYLDINGVSATAQFSAPVTSVNVLLVGVESTTEFGALEKGFTPSIIGQEAVTEFAVPSLFIDTNPSLTGLEVTAEFGPLEGDSPAVILSGVSATAENGTPLGDHPIVSLVGLESTTSQGIFFQSGSRTLFGVQATSQINTEALIAFRDVRLGGVYATAVGFFISGLAAGGGGGGAPGINGPGFRGEDGAGNGIGGAGGDGDNGTVPGQTVPGEDGLSGDEFDPTHGSGSGGAGASFGENPGGNGGKYGGGGGGGTGGGGGIGGDGVIYIKYLGAGSVWKTIILDVADNVNSPLTMPADYSSTNLIYLVSSGGCGSAGTLLAGGNGGSGGSILWGANIAAWAPGQVVPYHVPAGCEIGSVSFGDYSIENGGNATDTAAGLPGTHYTSFPGGQVEFSEGGSTGYSGIGIGGGGGNIFAFSYTGSEVNPFSVQATAEVGAFNLAGVPGDRTFIIGAIEQVPIAPGIVLLPTSEDIVLGSTSPYVIGSSQFYTIGQVYWDSALKVEGVDWEFVDPFRHVIRLLTPPSLGTTISLIYYRWNIGVRSGFKVNSYPVPFAFTGTTIVAERVPQLNTFFTVEYTTVRPGDNPRSLFAIMPFMVDDLLVSHTLYDGSSGFQTYRPVDYTVYDTTNNEVWKWDGNAWFSLGPYASGTQFYVKSLRQIYEYNGSTAVVVYTAGDGPSTIAEVLTYPLFGESIGKNFLADAFSVNAAIDYPSAYEVALRPGDYDPWISD